MSEDRISRRRRARQIVAARLERLEDLSVSKLVPSTLTLLGLCSGATAIRFALEQEWRNAVLAVVCAMIFDMLDGRAARMLGADSRFGAQLDSLADLVSFGLAPALILYNWTLAALPQTGWIAALIFCACSAIRLARFNVESVRDEGATRAHPYFTGLPTPAAACMVLLPLLLSFQSLPDDGRWFAQWQESVRQPVVTSVIMLVTAALMVSRLPTPSIKYMKLQRQYRFAAMLCFAVLAGLLIAWPWGTLTVGLVIYIASIPFAIVQHHPRRRRTV